MHTYAPLSGALAITLAIGFSAPLHTGGAAKADAITTAQPPNPLFAPSPLAYQYQ